LTIGIQRSKDVQMDA